MIGRRASGFEVTSVLVGGRRGNIYLATNPESGHRAAMRFLLADDTGESFADFGREVAAALQLPRRPEVVTRVLDDQREVLVALLDADAPGTGATRFPQTTRLERHARRPSWGRWLVLIPLAMLLGVLGWWRRQPLAPNPPVASPVEVAVPAVTMPTPPLVEPAHPEVIAPAVIEPEPARAMVPRTAPARGACVVTDEWRRARLIDLNEIQERVTVSDELSRTMQPSVDRLSVELRDARTDTDCRNAELHLQALARRAIPPQ
jgi:hypothetical protein